MVRWLVRAGSLWPRKAHAVLGVFFIRSTGFSFRCCVSQALSESRLRWFEAAGYRYGI